MSRTSAQKIIKAVAKYGKLIDFTSQGQGPLVQWIRKRFAALGKNATPDACLTLIYLSGELMNGLIPEIEKIAAGTAGELVTAEDVSRLALRIPEARVFEMTDYLAARDYDGAARTLADLMSMGEEPHRHPRRGHRYADAPARTPPRVAPGREAGPATS